MNLAPLVLIPVAVYVAFLNACSRHGRGITRWDIRNRPWYGSMINRRDHDDTDPIVNVRDHDDTDPIVNVRDHDDTDPDVSDEGDTDEEEIHYCKNGRPSLRTIYDDVKDRFDFIPNEELQQVILTLWDKDEDGRADGLFKTDWQYRMEQGIEPNDMRYNTNEFFRDVKHEELLRNDERRLLWELFKAYDTLHPGEIETATNNFFAEVTLSPPFRHLREYLMRKGHPNATNPDEFDATVKHIWTVKFSRSRGPRSSSALRHYLLGELKSYIVVNGPPEEKRVGLHNWMKVYYLQKNDRFIFQGYSPYYQHERILSIKYQAKEFRMRENERIEELLQPRSYASTTIGTTASFDIALMTLLYFTRADGACPKFFFGDCTAFEVEVRTSKFQRRKTAARKEYVGPMYARAIVNDDVWCQPRV